MLKNAKFQKLDPVILKGLKIIDLSNPRTSKHSCVNASLHAFQGSKLVRRATESS
jgi:hypothetical protein